MRIRDDDSNPFSTKKGISNGVRVTFRNVRSNLLSSTHT